MSSASTASAPDPRAAAYGRLSGVYDRLVSLYSFGQQQAAAQAWASLAAPGVRMLYVGAGTGAEALPAAVRGAEVTLLDRAAPMCARAEGLFAEQHCPARVLCADLLTFTPPEPFDVVATSFLLTVLNREVLPVALARLAAAAGPDGQVCIADYAPPPPGDPGRWLLRNGYHKVANVPLWLAGAARLHWIYDYEPLLPAAGLRIVERLDYPLWPGGPVMYRGWRCIRA